MSVGKGQRDERCLSPERALVQGHIPSHLWLSCVTVTSVQIWCSPLGGHPMSNDRDWCHSTPCGAQRNEKPWPCVQAHKGLLWVQPPPAPPCHGHQAALLGGPLSPGHRWVPRNEESVFCWNSQFWFHLCSLSCSQTPSSSTEPTHAGVTQTPRHKVTNRGQGVTLTCEPISGHDYLYWYRQTSVDGIKFLIYFTDTKPLDDTGMPNARFSAEMPNGSFSTLKIQSTEPEDSAMYLCASSLATALHSHPLPVQKPPASPSLISPQMSRVKVFLLCCQQEKCTGLGHDKHRKEKV